MTMTFSLHENFSLGNGIESSYEVNSASSLNRKIPVTTGIHLFADKLSTPKFRNYIKRPRLNKLLEKSLIQFGATLVTGRTGTGKSALAADFGRQYEKTAWFSISAADCEWNTFSSYFHSIFDSLSSENKPGSFDADKNEVSPFVESLFADSDLTVKEKPVLIVLDDVHNVFDADWFAEFFTTLLYSLTPDIHLLMLTRSNPPLPLWRLRSKQVLGVVDEKLLAFNLEETKKFLKRGGFPIEMADQLSRKSFGRISRLKTLADIALAQGGFKEN